MDSGLLVECPPYDVWALDGDLATWALEDEARYTECVERFKALRDRVIDMMNH